MAKREVLVVDDSVSVRQVLAILINGMGWATSECSGINLVMAYLDATAVDKLPSLILLEVTRDIGYKTIGLIKNNARYKNIPVIAFANNSVDNKLARQQGAVATFFKPFKEEDVKKLITSVVK